MGASGSDIAITISIIDKNGVATVQELLGAVNKLGDSPGPGKVNDGLNKVGDGALSSLEKVRLLNDDLGIRMPRAMQEVIAHSTVLSTAIGGIWAGLVAMGSVEIFERLGEGLYSAYEKYLDLNAAAQQYNDEVAKKKTEDFINPHTIETATLRINQATEAVKAYRAEMEQHEKAATGFGLENAGGALLGPLGSAFTWAHQTWWAHDAQGNMLDAQRQLDALQKERLPAQQHEQNIQQIELLHAADERLPREAKITAELEKQLAVNAENLRYLQQMDGILGNAVANYGDTVSRNGLTGAMVGKVGGVMNFLHSPTGMADQTAMVGAQGKSADDEMQQAEEVRRYREQATEAGLQGNALYYAQEQKEIDDVTAKFLSSQLSKQHAIEAVYDIQDRFYKEAQKRQEELDAQTRKMEADAATAGLTGIARIQAETQAALVGIDERERAAASSGTELPEQRSDFQRQRAALGSEGIQKQLEAERQYYEQMNQMMEGFTAQSQEGYARINADADKNAQAVLKSWETTWGQMDAMNLDWVLSVADAVGRAGQAYSAGAAEAARLHRETMDSLRKEEDLAARDSLPPWIAAELAIVDTYNDRVHKAKEMEDQQLADTKLHADQRRQIEQEYSAEVIAAGAVMNSQLQKQGEETRDKLAGSLQSFFKNPQQYIEQRAMDTAYQYMANQMMQLFQNHPGNAGVGAVGWLFGMNGEASTSTNASTFGHSLFGGHTGGGGLDAIASSAPTFQSSAQVHLQAGEMMLEAAHSMTLQGGGAGAGSDMMMPGFGGGSAGSDLSSAGASTATGGMGAGGGTGALGGMDISSALTGTTGPDMTGSYGTAFSGGLNANAATTAGTAASPWLGAAGAAITGGMGLLSAYQNSNPVAGLVSGAMSGAAIGSAFMPGVGTAIGAMVGGIAGILAGVFGDKGKGEAQDLDSKTVQPGIATELQQYNTGNVGYEQAAQYFDNLQIQVQNQTNAWGSGARNWYSGHILPEIQAAQQQIAQEEKGGRSLVALSAAQYHTGGLINDFGDLALNSTEGFILAQRGERMMTAAASSTHGPLLDAMNSGAIPPAMLRGSRAVPASAGAVGEVHLHIDALDAQSFEDWGRRGGSTKIRQMLNQGTGQYGGLGVR